MAKQHMHSPETPDDAPVLERWKNFLQPFTETIERSKYSVHLSFRRSGGLDDEEKFNALVQFVQEAIPMDKPLPSLPRGQVYVRQRKDSTIERCIEGDVEAEFRGKIPAAVQRIVQSAIRRVLSHRAECDE